MRTIMIVDDEPQLRALVRTTIEAPDCHVVEAASGEEALVLARQSAPDLVLLDWGLPAMSGLEVATTLRAEKATAQTPILMLTGRGQGACTTEALAAGVTLYITKPFSPLSLLEAIHAILERPR